MPPTRSLHPTLDVRRWTFNVLALLFCLSALALPLHSQTRILPLTAGRAPAEGTPQTHFRANPLTVRLTLDRTRPTATGWESIVAEIRRSVVDTTTPLASVTLSTPTGAGPFDLTFTGAQLNQSLAGAPSAPFWLVLYALDDSGETLDILHTGKFTLLEHAASQVAAAPPNVVAALSQATADTLYASLAALATKADATATDGRLTLLEALPSLPSDAPGVLRNGGTGKSWGTVPLEYLPILDATAHAADQIDRRIAGLVVSDATKKIFSTQDHAAGIYIRNPDCWAADVDLTGIGVWNSQTGAQIGFVAISPDHVLICDHATIANGATLRWVSGNVVVERTMTSSVLIAGTDLRVGTLASPLPATITPIGLPAANWGDGGSEGMAILATDQEKKVIVQEFGAFSSLVTPTDAQRLAFWEFATTGDSGNPWILLWEGQPFVMSLYHTAASGSLVHENLTAILAACALSAPSVMAYQPQVMHWDAVTNKPGFTSTATTASSVAPLVGQIPVVGSNGKLSPSILPSGPASLPLGYSTVELVASPDNQEIQFGEMGTGIPLSVVIPADQISPYSEAITIRGDSYLSNGSAWVDGFNTPADPLIFDNEIIYLDVQTSRVITLGVPNYVPENLGDATSRILDLPLYPVNASVVASTMANFGLGSLATLSAAPAGTLTGNTLAANVTASSLQSLGTLTGTVPGTVPGTSAPLGIHAGMLSGTPRVVWGTAVPNQTWAMDNSAGTMRWINQDQVRLSLSAAGAVNLTGALAASTINQSGFADLFIANNSGGGVNNRDTILSGRYLTLQGRTGIDLHDANSPNNPIYIGGRTASFPMLRRSGATLLFRNGADTAPTDISVRSVIQRPPASVNPADNGDLVFEATSNTTLTLKLKGTDGVVRSAAITLAP